MIQARAMTPIARPMPKILRRFAGDRRGVSAVEFALMAPLMIGLYLGCVEVADGVGVDRKVSLTAGTLANLAAQSTSISASDMTNLLDASSAIVAPYASNKLKMSLSCINIDSAGRATVKWNVTRNGGSAKSGSITIPTSLAVPSSQLLYAEVTYDYTPIVGYKITGTLTLSDKMYMSPRQTAPTYGTTACT